MFFLLTTHDPTSPPQSKLRHQLRTEKAVGVLLTILTCGRDPAPPPPRATPSAPPPLGQRWPPPQPRCRQAPGLPAPPEAPATNPAGLGYAAGALAQPGSGREGTPGRGCQAGGERARHHRPSSLGERGTERHTGRIWPRERQGRGPRLPCPAGEATSPPLKTLGGVHPPEKGTLAAVPGEEPDPRPRDGGHFSGGGTALLAAGRPAPRCGAGPPPELAPRPLPPSGAGGAVPASFPAPPLTRPGHGRPRRAPPAEGARRPPTPRGRAPRPAPPRRAAPTAAPQRRRRRRSPAGYTALPHPPPPPPSQPPAQVGR